MAIWDAFGTIWVPPAQICPPMGRPMGVQNGAIFTRWVAFRSIVSQCCFGLAFRVGFGRVPDQKSSDPVREVLQNFGFREGCKNIGFGLHFGSILAPFLAPQEAIWTTFLMSHLGLILV